MDRVYSVEDIKVRIYNSIDYYEKCIEAWEKVIRLHKKDGKDYAVFTRNFSNITFTNEYGFTKGKVYFHAKEVGYTADWIEYDDKTTPDEYERKIRERLSKYYKYVASEQEQLEMCDEVASEFIDTVNKAFNKVKEKTGGDSTIKFACEDYMKGLY